MQHYVYHLYGASGELLYVGRTNDPQRRKRCFERVHNVSVIQTVTPCTSLESAQELERQLIASLRPPYNKLVASATPVLGRTLSEAHREAIIKAQTGHKQSEYTKQALKLANSGKTLTPDQIEKWHAKMPLATSGVRGITWDMSTQKWKVRKTIKGTRRYLGLFDTVEKAITAMQGV